MLFFQLSSLELGILLFGILLSATLLGAVLGRRARNRSDTRKEPIGILKEPIGILQGALLGIVGLLLAFGLSLAVSRYEDRRANVVSEANAIGTTYLRAQTLAEPVRRAPPRPLARDVTQKAVEGVTHRHPGNAEPLDELALGRCGGSRLQVVDQRTDVLAHLHVLEPWVRRVCGDQWVLPPLRAA